MKFLSGALCTLVLGVCFYEFRGNQNHLLFSTLYPLQISQINFSHHLFLFHESITSYIKYFCFFFSFKFEKNSLKIIFKMLTKVFWMIRGTSMQIRLFLKHCSLNIFLKCFYTILCLICLHTLSLTRTV